MKKITIILVLFYISLSNTFGQCQNFTFNKVVPKLGNYLMTGKYHSFMLMEGEETLIYKTVDRGISYRFIVESDDNLPQPVFTILDWNNNVIFDNSKNDMTSTFDYQPKQTKKIKIIIKVPEPKQKSIPKEGCVSLVVGIKS